MKQIILFALLIAFSLNSFAQEENSGKKISFGIRAGYNSSNITELVPSPDETPEKRQAANFGVISNIRINEHFVLRPGIYYSIKGRQYPDTKEWKTTLKYLEMPLLAVLQ